MSTATEPVPELGAGIYSFPAAARLVGERPRKLHYWMESGFLQPDTEYEWEVLAIEKSGNQTLSSATFTTSG